MSNAWRRARGLTLRDYRMILEAAASLVRAHAALRLRSPARVLSGAASISDGSRRLASDADSQEVARMARLFGIASRRLVRVPCLSRSVALARMLSRRRMPCHIRIGVRTSAGNLEAHAWVEWNGRALLEDEATLQSYAPFDEPLRNLPAARLMYR